MPIKIPGRSCPPPSSLEGENIFVMTEYRAMHQDIRPLKRAAAQPHAHEDRHRDADHAQAVQHARCRSRWTCCTPSRHESKNVSRGASGNVLHARSTQIKDQSLRRHDHHRRARGAAGLRGRGLLGRAAAASWQWSTTNVHSTLHICWGAQAGIYYHYGIPEARAAEEALRRVRARRGEAVQSPLVRGFDDRVLGAALPLHRRVRRGYRGATRAWN